MKRRSTLADRPAEMPAYLRVFALPAGDHEGRRRWSQERIEWCRDNDVDFIDQLQTEARSKREAARQAEQEHQP